MFYNTRKGLIALGLSLPLISSAMAGGVTLTHMQPPPLCRMSTKDGLSSALCPVSFSAVPSFAGSFCLGATQTGVYTLTNNLRQGVLVKSISILVSDSLPATATAILPSPTTTCVVGSPLAAGASCNIGVSLLGTNIASMNRTLQVGLSTRQVLTSPIVSTVTTCAAPTPNAIPGVTPVAGVNSCAILAATPSLTNTGPTLISGFGGAPANICISPAASITGFPPGTFTGTENTPATGTVAATAQASTLTLFNSLNALSPQCINEPADVGGLTLSQGAGTTGVYCFASTAAITGTLTLNGPGNYIFLVGSALTTAAGGPPPMAPASVVLLTNGASAANVYWAVQSAATLGTYSIFQGRIIANATITLTTGAQLFGSASSLTAAVALDTNSVVQQVFTP